MYGYNYSDTFFPLHMFGGLFMFVFWVFVVYAIVTLLKRTKSNDKNKALEILKERYAKGEVTKHEFDSMKKDLE